MKFFFQSVSVLLTGLLASGPVFPQVAGASDMQLHLIETGGNSAAAGSATGKGFTVQVTSSSGAGLADVALVLHLPDTGVTGVFPDGSHAAIAYSDQSGAAHFPAIRWGPTPGAIAIRLTATKGTAHAGMLLEQTLTAALAAIPAAEAAKQSELPPSSAPASLPKPAATTADSAPLPAASTPKPRAQAEPGILERSDRVPAPAAPSAALAPSVSVVNGPTGEKIHSSSGKTKWIIIAAIAAGAGAGLAMMGKGKSNSSSNASSSPTIGAPSISIGHP